MVVHNIFYDKTILESNIYAKHLLLHDLTGCDIISSINETGKAMVFKKTFQIKICQKQY